MGGASPSCVAVAVEAMVRPEVNVGNAGKTCVRGGAPMAAALPLLLPLTPVAHDETGGIVVPLSLEAADAGLRTAVRPLAPPPTLADEVTGLFIIPRVADIVIHPGLAPLPVPPLPLDVPSIGEV